MSTPEQQDQEAAQEWFEGLTVGDSVKLSYPGAAWRIFSKSSSGFTVIRYYTTERGIERSTRRWVGPYKMVKAFQASTR